MKNRIKVLMKQRGLSNERLAELTGSHPVTISKVINGHISLNQKWMNRLAEALHVTPADLIDGRPELRMVTVKGYVQAGEWSESWELEEEDQYQVPVPADEVLLPYTLHAAETRGESMNRRYPEGTVVVFTEAIETGEHPQFGKRYVVERERADGMREATVKLLWKNPIGRAFLLPESDDPKFQSPIALESDNDGDTIRIIGQVRYAITRE